MIANSHLYDYGQVCESEFFVSNYAFRVFVRYWY